MPIPFARREFLPAPPGIHNAVCVDIIDRGIMPNSYGGEPQPKVEIRWQSEKKIPRGPAAGKPFLLRKLYTNSRHEKATVRKDLETWRGRSFSKEELRDWDYEKLIGQPCTLVVVHKVGNDGETRARVEGVLPADPNARRLTPVDYQRAEPQQDHDAGPQPDPVDSDYGPEYGPETEEEVPF